MVTRAEVVAEARSWIGTPFHHQQELKGVGCDCAGLLRGVCIALGTWPADYRSQPFAAPYLGYGRSPDGKKMRAGCDEFMTPISKEEMGVGDVILIRWAKRPQHLGIVGDYVHGGLSMIHAFGDVDGKGSVLEHRLDASYMARFIAAYRLPGVEA